MSSHSGSGADGSGIAGTLLLVTLMVVILLIWLVVQAAHLVAQAFRREPRNKALVMSFVALLASLLGMSVAGAMRLTVPLEILGSVAVVSAVVLLIVSRSIVVATQTLFSAPREQPATKVLRHSWWPPTDAVA